MPAFIIGSTGVLADTDDHHRRALDAALSEAGHDWRWSAPVPAGRGAIEEAAAARGARLDAGAIRARASELFREALAPGIAPRPGVIDALDEMRRGGRSLALVSTASRADIDATLEAAGIDAGAFDAILDGGEDGGAAPDPARFAEALGRLEAEAGDALAVSDSPEGVAAARAAGIDCMAFPGAGHAAQDFDRETVVLDRLAPAPATRSD